MRIDRAPPETLTLSTKALKSLATPSHNRTPPSNPPKWTLYSQMRSSRKKGLAGVARRDQMPLYKRGIQSSGLLSPL